MNAIIFKKPRKKKKNLQNLLNEYERFFCWVEGWWEGWPRPQDPELSNHPFVKKMAEIKKLREEFYSSS